MTDREKQDLYNKLGKLTAAIDVLDSRISLLIKEVKKINGNDQTGNNKPKAG